MTKNNVKQSIEHLPILRDMEEHDLVPEGISPVEQALIHHQFYTTIERQERDESRGRFDVLGRSPSNDVLTSWKAKEEEPAQVGVIYFEHLLEYTLQ